MSTSTDHPVVSPLLLTVMAMATGLSVANNYYIQPLLDTITRIFSISKGQGGLLVTVAQLSYAAGLLFLIPVADIVERRRIIVGMMSLSALGVLLIATSQNIVLLSLGVALTGLFSVVTQLFMPLAVSLCQENQRGKVVGSIMTGLLLGILLARTIAGALAEIGGWHAVYWLAFVLMSLMTATLAKLLPWYSLPVSMSYKALLLSVVNLFRTEKVFRNRSIIGLLNFANFSILWTPLAFLLASGHYGYSEGTIGLFGLIGAGGALVTRPVGKIIDKGRNFTVTLAGLILLSLSWVPLMLGGRSLAALILGIVMLDVAVQSTQVANQSSIFQSLSEAHNRMTSGYMTCYFLGGAAGSMLSAYAYSLSEWSGVVAVGAIFSLANLFFCLRERHAL